MGQPVDIYRANKTVKTHDNANVPLSGSIASTWMDVAYFNSMAVTLVNSAATASTVDIEWSHDGTTVHAKENVLASGATTQRIGTIETKAQFARVVVGNADGALAHIMNAWLYLKS